MDIQASLLDMAESIKTLRNNNEMLYNMLQENFKKLDSIFHSQHNQPEPFHSVVAIDSNNHFQVLDKPFEYPLLIFNEEEEQIINAAIDIVVKEENVQAPIVKEENVEEELVVRVKYNRYKHKINMKQNGPRKYLPGFDGYLQPFLCSLWTIVNKGIGCKWSESGTSFIIYNIEELEEKVLSKYYKHNNYSSFRRQLSLYCFKQLRMVNTINNIDNTYEISHPYFQKDSIHLLSLIARNNRRERVDLISKVNTKMLIRK